MTDDRSDHQHVKSELITFSIGEQDFCMDIMAVREIRGWTGVTMLPHSPPDVMGVMNLRGAVVPIVDLAARLGLERCRDAGRTVIIVANIGEQTVGFLVSAVSDIVSIAPDEVQPMPRMDGLDSDSFVKGIIASQERTLRVLDIATLSASMIASPVDA
ncbi:chemotaxis protein CheW [Palleronia pelagia]|uniref:Purine-binding chemotaxis protein CheW n=1 Tax=Palleronia pelagia TaxID=387096 RepID=A0A1H8AY49_9RHOB|nr:chemotaxis protein CheW [Palleronia pelagia]SEM75701.1 purine-binding chemotaxis protein CheW [Palleronia pelagia]